MAKTFLDTEQLVALNAVGDVLGLGDVVEGDCLEPFIAALQDYADEKKRIHDEHIALQDTNRGFEEQLQEAEKDLSLAEAKIERLEKILASIKVIAGLAE